MTSEREPASDTRRAEWLSPPHHRDAFHRIDSFLDTVDVRAGAGAPVALVDATGVLAWALERAAATPYPQLMQERLWRHVGAEADALVTVDDVGVPSACAGMAMRLRDLARFGLLLQAQGAGRAHRSSPPRGSRRPGAACVV